MADFLVVYASGAQAIVAGASTSDVMAAQVAAGFNVQSVLPLPGAGATGEVWTRRLIVNAEVLTLPTARIRLVTSPGANVLLLPRSVYTRQIQAAPYATRTKDPELFYSGTIFDPLTAALPASAVDTAGALDQVNVDPVKAGLWDFLAGAPGVSLLGKHLEVGVDQVANYTAGNAGNSLDVILGYTAVPF